MFKCGKHKEAISRLRGLIAAVDEKTKGHYVQVCKSCNNRSQTLLLTFSSGPWEDVLEAGGLPKCGADA